MTPLTPLSAAASAATFASGASSGPHHVAVSGPKPLLPELGAGNSVPPPSAATPPGIALSSGVGTPFTGVIGLDLELMSVAADGTLWLVNQTDSGGRQILTYNFAAATLQPVYTTPDTVVSVAAVSADALYVIVAGSATWIGCLSAQGAVEQLPALPDGATPAQVTAAVDGTLWALDSNGLTYAYSATDSQFAAVPAPGLKFNSISVGSAGLIVGLASLNGQPPMAYTWTAATGWTPLPSLAGTTGQWLAACADGTLWFLTSTALAVLLADGTVKVMDVSSVVGASSWTAASRMSAYVAGLSGTQIGIFPVALGILDLPAVPWPAFTPDQQTAYNDISTALSITTPGGIRAQYSNGIATLSSWQLTVATMAAPTNVSAADWQMVKTQIMTELTYVQAVNNLYTQLGKMTGLLSTMQSDQLQGVAAAVGLTVQAQGPSKVTVVLDSLFSTLVTRIGSLFPPPYGLVVSLIGSGLMAASTYTQQKYSPNGAQGALTVAYSNLATALAYAIAETTKAQGDEQTVIVQDWGKLSAAGQAIAQGIWTWPDNMTGQTLEGLAPVMQLYLYQALMPAAWQLLQGEILFTARPPVAAKPHAPSSAMMVKYVVDSSYDQLVWYYICCAAGSPADIVGNTGPYPSPTLLQNIFTLGVQPQDLFGGQNGWALPTVQSPGWTAPDPSINWQPYAR
ncbi:hypothetical protein [Hymenobacter lucidus]|uniref:Uncharacterized protein n=1 Tax=Hymenobacter lucidus TaxID=2880930 RepID=A0ABS8AL42_9BACT|nr:hypothetical protein [Hymenobacter lucidus]MCB2406935.1 hypothetical protein [Hymenobacter lucidus]